MLVYIHYGIIRYLAPAEENGGNMDVQIQALIQSKRPTPIVLIDNKSNPLSIALSQFIAQGQPIVQGSDLADLYITNQPKRSRKHFTINCLKRGECSIIAGRNSQQREGFHVKVRSRIDRVVNLENIYLVERITSL